MVEIVVCDDDANDLDDALKILNEALSDCNVGYNISGFTSANDVLEGVPKIDVGILDIAMHELNGIELGRKLKEKFPQIQLIYITSYEEYCIQAINEVHAYAFLCKPLNKKDVRKQVIAAIRNISGTAIEMDFYKVIDSKKKEHAALKLNLEDILYIEYIKRQRRAAIVLRNEVYECECVFETLAEELKQYDFEVTRRGCMVNLRHVDKIQGFILYIDNGEQLQIAQKRIVNFREKMIEFLRRNS